MNPEASTRTLSVRASALKRKMTLDKMATSHLGMAERIQHELDILRNEDVLSNHPSSILEEAIMQQVLAYMKKTFDHRNDSWLTHMEYNLACATETELQGMKTILTYFKDGDKRVNDILLGIYDKE